MIIHGNDGGDLVLMARADYDDYRENTEFFDRLCGTLDERITETKESDKTVSHDTVMQKARNIIGEGYRKANV